MKGVHWNVTHYWTSLRGTEGAKVRVRGVSEGTESDRKLFCSFKAARLRIKGESQTQALGES